MIWWHYLAGCDGAGTTTPPSPPTECDGGLTWANAAGPVVITWCQPCHSAGVVGEARQGAPDGLDFDTPAQVLAAADRVRVRATGPDANMPPAGGPTDAERERLAEWLTCGTATGTTETPLVDLCTPRVAVAGDTRVSAWDCAAGNVVEGDLAVDAASDCICEVTGTVTAEGSVDLPELATIGGDLLVLGPAASVRLPWLTTVAGSVRLEGNAGLVELDLVRLEEIGADLTLIDNTSLLALQLMGSLGTVRDVTIRGNTALGVIDGLARVATARSLTVTANPSLVSLRSFQLVTSLDRELVFEDNDALLAIDVMHPLTRAAAIRIRDNDALDQIASFVFLTELDGDLEISGQASLRVLGSGATSGGPLQALAEVGGSVLLTDNAALEDVVALQWITTVGGDLTITSNPQLGAAQVDALVQAIDEVGGTVTVEGNGP